MQNLLNQTGTFGMFSIIQFKDGTHLKAIRTVPTTAKVHDFRENTLIWHIEQSDIL